jgi:hypothetical protein
MPQIIVTAGTTADDDDTVTLRERVNVSDFESERFTANLAERLGWAVIDAAEAERAAPEGADERPKQGRTDDRHRPITGDRRRKTEHESQLEPVGSA